MADGDNVARPANVQVRTGEGDETRVSHSMLVPMQHTIRRNQVFPSEPILHLKALSFC